MEKVIILACLFALSLVHTIGACRKSGGATQEGVDASVMAVVWGIVCLVSFLYLSGVVS